MNYKNYKIEHLSSDRLWIGHYPCGDADGGNGRLIIRAGDNAGSMTIRSNDGGRTWSPVSKVEDFGVLPRLLKMKNGAVVLASGKWDTFLKISADDGESWSDRIIVKENRGQWDRGPSGYTSIFETADDELLIVYDHTDDPVSDDIKYGERRVIYADRFRITAEK